MLPRAALNFSFTMFARQIRPVVPQMATGLALQILSDRIGARFFNTKQNNQSASSLPVATTPKNYRR